MITPRGVRRRAGRRRPSAAAGGVRVADRPARQHDLTVTRSARYLTLGEPGPSVRQVWFVLHGYGQLAPFFIRHFKALDDGTRLIVAPEALNRFYVEQTSWHGAGHARVGASWMTREERLSEIRDYVGYLDAVGARVLADLDRDAVRVVVLGFSQGVATAARWLAQGCIRADMAVLWAGPLPTELTPETAAPLVSLRLVRVLGDEDEMAAPEVVAAEEARSRALGLSVETIRFKGGHQLDPDVLAALAR